ncbi:MAG: hypothetical protein U0289_18165 [Cyclobacteriaceae bacterium]
MGVTSIKKFVNETNYSWVIHNLENPAQSIEVRAGQTVEYEMWIPWAATPYEWNHKRIVLIPKMDQPEWSVWQRASSDGDKIRAWHNWQELNPVIQGDSSVDGNRNLHIKEGELIAVRV